LILRKISKIGDTRCQILRQKCTKFDFRWGSAPDPTGTAFSAPPVRLAVFKGPTFKEMGEREGRGKEGEEEGHGGEGYPIQLGTLDPAVEEGRGGEKGKEGSLVWGVHAGFPSFHFKHCMF